VAYRWQEQQSQEALRRELAHQEMKRHQLAEAELRRLAYTQKFRLTIIPVIIYRV
jgi:hypothetical protein